MSIRNIFIFLTICCTSAWSYKILMVCSPPSRSHYNLCSAVTNILAERNHEVTFITAFAADKPNFKEILVDMSTFFNNMPSVFSMVNSSIWQSFPNMIMMTDFVTNAIFSNQEVKKMMNDKREKYDLVILEYFMNQNLLGFSVKYDCPAILLAGVSMMPWVIDASGNPVSIATLPSAFTKNPIKMNLWERTKNTLVQIFQYITEYAYFSPELEKLYLKYFPEESKTFPFKDLGNKVSAVLSNTHQSISPARATLPNVVEIAGYHIEKPSLLPEDLQRIMDSAKDGVIFFSMGSVVKPKEMSEHFRNSIIKALSKFKQTVLWKFDQEIKDLPKNIITRKWLPQTAILAHPNLKLFITHGGFLSCTEATHFGVPILMIPVFGDQNHNAKIFSDRGQGLTIQYNDISESTIQRSVEEMLSNPKYAESAKRVSAIFHDRPVNPRDLVAYQVEHVIRTGGGSHLSPPRLPLYSILLLDVMALIFAPILFIALLLRCLFKKICGSKTQKKLKRK